MIKNANDELFDSLFSEGKPVLVDFYATWCGPCKTLSSTIDQLAESRTDIVVAKVDVEEAPDVCAELKIRSVPTVILFSPDKKVQTTLTGIRSKETYIEEIDKYLNK
jgi:thioredoxin 1